MLLAGRLIPMLWLLLTPSISLFTHNNTDLFFLSCSLDGSRLSHRTGSLQVFPHDILWAQSPVWCDSERPVVLAVVIMHVHCLVIFIDRLVQYSEPKLWCSSNEKHYTLSLVCGQMKSSYILCPLLRLYLLLSQRELVRLRWCSLIYSIFPETKS